MIYDLRVQGASGAAAKSITITPGSTTPIVLEVWGSIGTLNANNTITLASGTCNFLRGAMKFTSAESDASKLMGNMSDSTLNPSYWALKSAPDNTILGTSQQYDTNTDKEWGGAAPTSAVGYYFPQCNATAVDGNSLLFGTITWTPTVTLAGATDVLQVVSWSNYSFSNHLYYGIYLYMENGVLHTGNNSIENEVISGEPVTVTIVPEPSTIALLLTAIIGGLLWWRRRR